MNPKVQSIAMILSLVAVLLVVTPMVAYYGVMPAMKGGIGQSPTLSAMNTTVWTVTGYTAASELLGLVPFVFIGSFIIVVLVIVILLRKDEG